MRIEQFLNIVESIYHEPTIIKSALGPRPVLTRTDWGGSWPKKFMIWLIF